MGDGTKLALAILVVFVAMVAFFFAFHPGGVEAANNPNDVLSWLTLQFEAAAQGESGDLAKADNPAADQPEGKPEKKYVPPQTKDVGPNG